jgi:LPS export ABC transporter protein LptC
MNWRNRRTGRLLPVFFFFFLLFFGDLLAQEETSSPTPLPVLGKKVEIRGWEEGKLSWLLRAAELRLDKQGNLALAREVELEVYDREGMVRSTLKAGSAEIDLQRKTFRFWDEVEVVSRDGDRILTEELLYRERLKKLESQSTTRVFFNGNTIECQGFSSDIDFENPEFYHIIQGSFRLSSP